MEFDWIWVLAAFWFVVNLISNARRKPAQPGRPAPPRSTPPNLQSRPQPRIVHPEVDPTQREGSRLELVLRDLQRTMEEAAETGYSTTLPPPLEEEIEDNRSLEVEPEVRSLEGDVRREARRRFDQDDEAADIEARRVQAAAARDATRTRADHAAFDQRIRQEPAEHTAVRGYTPQQLRDAIVWREILGPPVSER
jgi:hypothetical protein